MKTFKIQYNGKIRTGYTIEEFNAESCQCKFNVENNLVAENVNNETEFINWLSNNNIKFNKHQAMSGSQYWNINGVQFRVSDHEQPSHYQIRSYVDCSSYNEVIQELCKSDFFDTEFSLLSNSNEVYTVSETQSMVVYKIENIKFN